LKNVRLRICFIGNLESIHLQRFARSFADSGHEVHVISDKPVPMPGITVHPILLMPRLEQNPLRRTIELLIRAFQVHGIVHRIQPDVVHSHFVLAYGIYGALSGKKPHVLSTWGSDVTLTRKWTIRHVLSNIAYAGSDKVCTGDTSSKDLLVSLGCEPDKVFIQPWGVDNAIFSPGARSEALRNRLLGDSDGVLLTMVSAIDPVYDIESLVKALPLVKSDTPFKLVLIGDGKQRDDLVKLVADLGVTDLVTFLGRIPHDKIHDYYASSDIYIDTCHPEGAGAGIGVAVMEAMSSGLPVLCANRQGVEVAIFDGLNGYLFKGGESYELAEKISTLIANPELRVAMGTASRERSLKIGNWDNQMKELENLYLTLMKYHSC
jgi:glycosyltransferase involved in cell wall biosynthesis